MTCSHEPRPFDGTALTASGLSFGRQRLVVWGVRHCVACVRHDTDSWDGLSQAFAGHRAADAAFSLDGLMQITRMATTRPVDIRCPACIDISADERRFRATVAAAQQGDTEAAAAALADWLPPTAVRFAVAMAEGLARALLRAGLPMPTAYPPPRAQPYHVARMPMASTAIH